MTIRRADEMNEKKKLGKYSSDSRNVVEMTMSTFQEKENELLIMKHAISNEHHTFVKMNKEPNEKC